ncbi:MAG: ABC transporter permease [bacterium]
MTYNFLLITALRSFARHKMRSFLTTIGIIIGIVAIIAVMSIGQGAKSKVQSQINKLGTNFMIIFGSSPKRMVAMKGQGYGNLTLKPEDFQAIVEECEDIKDVAPLVVKTVTAVYEGSNWQTMIGGTNEKLLSIRNLKPILGTNFTKQDIKSKSKVVILGKTVAQELFAGKNPIGEIIRIKNFPFKVIGVLEEQGKTPDGRDQDDTILAPITTVHRKILGAKNQNFSIMMLNAKEKDRMEQASSDVRSILRQKHKLKEIDEDDFTLFTQDDVAQAADEVSKILNLLLVIIASISLIVGGIGIMNIMLVTVAERTREIGLRMAVGATTQGIQNQFILEAITICLIGGFLGIFFGIITSIIVGKVLSWTITISIKSIIIALISSTSIGLFFGFYPAYKASQLNPVEALFER